MIFPFVALNYQRVQSSFPLFPSAHYQRDHHHLRPSQGPPFVVEQPSPWDHPGVGTMNSTPAVYVESLERGYRVATPLSKEHDKETQWMVGCLYIYCIYIYPFCCFSTYSTQQLSMFCCGFWPRSCSLQVFAMVLAANLWPQSPSKESGRGRLFLGGINDLPKAGATAMATSTLSDESWQICCDGSISGKPLYRVIYPVWLWVSCWTNNHFCFLCHW